jgi:hypothetical protein
VGNYLLFAQFKGKRRSDRGSTQRGLCMKVNSHFSTDEI